jgi:predicted nucleic acid-binding protein
VTRWLLDTNVLSELRRPRPNANVVRFVSEQAIENLYASAATLAEIRYGIEQVDDALKQIRLNTWLEHTVRPMLADRVNIDEEILLRWRIIVENARQQGYTFGEPDGLIAATAKHHGLTVVSRDVTAYEFANVPVLNPWK